jgi:hypothetical protein
MFTEFLLFLSSMLGITWSMGFLISGIFGISVYKVSGQKMQAFMKDVKYASIWNNEEPEGWIIGLWYIGYVYKSTSGRGDTSTELNICCSKRFYNVNIAKNDDVDEEDKVSNTSGKPSKPSINFIEKEGTAYWNLFYIQRKIKTTTLLPRQSQSDILQHIYQEFVQRSYVVTLLYGDPGNGKSMIPYFLAKYMLNDALPKYKKVSLIDTFNPFQPGEKFSTLYTRISPSKDSPLIVVLEEIDIMINKMHCNTIVQHRDIPTLISNKSDWNMFLDRFDRGLYPHVIFIMTTNKSAEYFDELDPSYMRLNRVNIKCKV